MGRTFQPKMEKEVRKMDEKGKNDMTRRDFMKNVAKGTAGVGLAAMMPGLVKPARAVKRDYILIGHPNPSTGPISAFGEPCPWINNKAVDAINKAGGIYIKEYGQKVPVKFKLVDTESNPTKAGELAARLILHDKVDLMIVLSTPLTVNPVTAMCERYEVPCIALDDPAEAWLQGGPYHWSFLAFWSVDSYTDLIIGLWDEYADRTNRVLGGLWPNDPDGIAWANHLHKKLPPKGYKIIDAGRFPFGMSDWTSIITRFKKENVEILHAMLIAPDWASCWRQMHQLGFIPKIGTIDKPVLFPADVNALGGELPNGLNTGFWWSPHHPWKSSLSGESPKDICDAWTEETGKQWNAALGFKYAGYELAADVLKRAKTLDKKKIRDAIEQTDCETIVGPIKFNEQHYCETPLVIGQWHKGKKWPWEIKLVYNKTNPHIPLTGKMIFPLPGYK